MVSMNVSETGWLYKLLVDPFLRDIRLVKIATGKRKQVDTTDRRKLR